MATIQKFGWGFILPRDILPPSAEQHHGRKTGRPRTHGRTITRGDGHGLTRRTTGKPPLGREYSACFGRPAQRTPTPRPWSVRGPRTRGLSRNFGNGPGKHRSGPGPGLGLSLGNRPAGHELPTNKAPVPKRGETMRYVCNKANSKKCPNKEECEHYWIHRKIISTIFRTGCSESCYSRLVKCIPASKAQMIATKKHVLKKRRLERAEAKSSFSARDIGFVCLRPIGI